MARVENLLARARGLDARTVDYVLAACLAVVAAALLSGTHHPFPAVVFGVVGAATVATRRRTPVVSIVVVAATTLLVALVDRGVDETTLGFAAGFCFYTLGRSAARRAPLIDLALIGLAVPVVAVTPPKSAVNIVAGWLLFVVLAYVGGRTFRPSRHAKLPAPTRPRLAPRSRPCG